MNMTKRKIFEIATQLFAEKGYEATSIEEITAVVGIAKGTLYYHFESKEELFKQLVKDGADFLKKSIDIKTRKVTDAKEKIKRIIIIQIKISKKFDKFMIMLFNQMWGNEERNRFVREKINEYIDKIRKVVEEAIEQKYFNSDNKSIITDLIFGQISCVLMRKLKDEEIDVEKLGEEYLKAILI